MTSSNGNIFRVTGPLCGISPVTGEFPAKRPVTRSFDVFFDLRLNKLLGKRSWGWWFETPSCSLWRHLNILGTRCISNYRHYFNVLSLQYDSLMGPVIFVFQGLSGFENFSLMFMDHHTSNDSELQFMMKIKFDGNLDNIFNDGCIEHSEIHWRCYHSPFWIMIYIVWF